MPRAVPPQILQRVTTAESKLIAQWKEGVSIEARSQASISDLCARSAADRINLARDCLRRARILRGLDPPMFRDAISRYYYAIYHAFRAVAFFTSNGDDFDDHSSLAKGIPDEFPSADQWRNDLKTARLARNAADYNAYPKLASAWRSDCEKVAALADQAVPAVRSYLIQKGCSLR